MSKAKQPTRQVKARVWFSLLLLTLVWPTGPLAAPRVVRVMTYNIHHGEGTDREFDLVRLAEIIKSAKPDLVALQEVDQGTERSAGVNQLTELGQLTGMQAAFGKAIEFQGGGYGVGVLSRWAILNCENFPLPGSPNREARTALTLGVRIGDDGPLLQFTSTHLDQGQQLGNRVAQANELNTRLVSGEGQPSILAGDMNSGAESEVMQILDAQWMNMSPPDTTLFSPSGRPMFSVDHVLVRPSRGWRIVESTVVDAPVASDHRPVLVVLEWTEDSETR